MKTILVTGCAGFIGSNLIDFLFKKYTEIKIIGIDNFDLFYDKAIKIHNMQGFIENKQFIFKELDLSNANSYKEMPVVDLVIHLAAKAGVRPSILNPFDYINANIIATQHLLDWMSKNNIKKYIFASSSSVYGNNKKIPFEETDNVDFAISPYAFTKKSCEILNYTFHHIYKIDCLNLRFFTVYGPRQRPDLAIHKFIQKISLHQPLEIFGDGNTSRDYTYIIDIVKGIDSSIDYIFKHKNIYEIINLGNNQPINLLELIKIIEEEMNQKAILQFQEMQIGDVDLTFASIEKAKKILHYKPTTTIVEGIKNFIIWRKEMGS